MKVSLLALLCGVGAAATSASADRLVDAREVARGSYLALHFSPDGKDLLITGLPANARVSDVQWSPDNTKIAFTHTTNNHVELWIADVASASARLVPNLFLNGVFGTPYEWVSDSKTIIARAVVGGRGFNVEAHPVNEGNEGTQQCGVGAHSVETYLEPHVADASHGVG